jgi:SPP1 gp7 family putative phage head morphogenesis protein
MPSLKDLVIAERKKNLQRVAKKRLSKAPKWLHPLSIEREYQRMLVAIVERLAVDIRAKLFPVLAANDTGIKFDAAETDIARELGFLSRSFDDQLPQYEAQATTIGNKVAGWNNAQWQKIIRAVIGVNTALYPANIDSLITSFALENVSLIKSIKDKAVTDISGMAQRGVRDGIRYEKLAKEIEAQFNTTKARAKFIARDQVSKLNGQLTKTRQTDLGITEYTWVTAQDDRVRDTHKNMSGKRCRWDNPDVYWNGSAWVSRAGINGVQQHPGSDYNCRCYGSGIFEELLK